MNAYSVCSRCLHAHISLAWSLSIATIQYWIQPVKNWSKLTQNAAYQGWHKNSAIGGCNSGYLTLDLLTTDNQIGGIRYSNSIAKDCNYV